MSIALVRASSGAGELTEVLTIMTLTLVNGIKYIGDNYYPFAMASKIKVKLVPFLQVRRIAQFFRIMRIVRIFKVSCKILSLFLSSSTKKNLQGVFFYTGPPPTSTKKLIKARNRCIWDDIRQRRFT